MQNGSLFLSSRSSDRLDSYFYNQLADKKQFVNFWKVVKLLLLSHGQATVERGFSVNKDLKECNIAEKTLKSDN